MEEGLTILSQIFDDIHEKTYGFKMDTEVEIVNIRSIAIGKVNSPKMPVLQAGTTDASIAIIDAEHEAYFNGQLVKTPIYDRTLLKPKNEIQGPAIITQRKIVTWIF